MKNSDSTANFFVKVITPVLLAISELDWTGENTWNHLSPTWCVGCCVTWVESRYLKPEFWPTHDWSVWAAATIGPVYLSLLLAPYALYTIFEWVWAVGGGENLAVMLTTALEWSLFVCFYVLSHGFLLLIGAVVSCLVLTLWSAWA